MKTLIICFSFHHSNTLKLASVFSKVLSAKIKSPQEINPKELKAYDLIGFGSGIYNYTTHPSLLKLADSLPKTKGKAFIFSTSGIRVDSPIFRNARKWHKELREKLQSKGYEIVGEFNCAGWNTNSFLKHIGGIRKGHPNEKDLKEAEEFAEKLKK